MSRGFVVAIVGAESTGRTTLAMALRDALIATGRNAVVVPEYLREFCEQHARTPWPQEQAGIAAEQTRRIDEAAATHDIVIADTTALMVAVYSEHVFGDCSLHAHAEALQRGCDLTLLTALDIPWGPDGHQRDGPHTREPVDALLRAALQRAQVGYAVVLGSGHKRLAAALQAVRQAMAIDSPDDEAHAAPHWQWACERCGDPACERHILPRLL